MTEPTNEQTTPISITLYPDDIKRLDELAVKLGRGGRSAAVRMAITETHDRYVLACAQEQTA